MQVSNNPGLLLSALVFGLLLIPSGALAAGKNCPVEPASTSIIPGEVYAGKNCNLNTDGDRDVFTFTGTKGYTYQIEAALNGAATNVCVDLIDPKFNVVAGPVCTSIGFPNEDNSTGFEYTPTSTATYTIDIWETSSVKQNYAVSLEQFNPFPSYATYIPKFGEVLPGDITPITDANLFTLHPTATTGEYLWSVTLPGNASQNICLWVYLSNGTAASGSPACTSIGFPNEDYEAQVQISKPQPGGNMAVVEVAGNDGTQAYSFEVSCVAGYCPPPIPPPPPPCTLDDAPSYDAATGTLTMNFRVGNNFPAAWSAWLTYADPQGTAQDTMETLFSAPQKITVPPRSISKKVLHSVPKEGTVGILSTLTTAKKGIACSSWVQIDTGTEP